MIGRLGQGAPLVGRLLDALRFLWVVETEVVRPTQAEHTSCKNKSVLWLQCCKVDLVR